MNSIVSGAQGSGILPLPPQASQEVGRPPCTDQGCTCVWCCLRVTQEPLLLQASYRLVCTGKPSFVATQLCLSNGLGSPRPGSKSAHCTGRRLESSDGRTECCAAVHVSRSGTIADRTEAPLFSKQPSDRLHGVMSR